MRAISKSELEERQAQGARVVKKTVKAPAPQPALDINKINEVHLKATSEVIQTGVTQNKILQDLVAKLTTALSSQKTDSKKTPVRRLQIKRDGQGLLEYVDIITLEGTE